MPNTVLSAILPSQAFRVYNDKDGSQIWRSLAITRAEIEASSNNARKPISDQKPTQQATFDALLVQDIKSTKIIRPAKINLTALVPDVSTVENLISTWLSRETTITVMSRGVIAANMAVVNLQFEQGPEMLSAQRVTIELEQTLVASFNKYDPAQPADASNYGIKIQTPSSVTGTIADVYNRVLSFVGSLI